MAGTPQRQLQASIIPVLLPKSFIEKRKIDITDYAKKICSRNREQGKLITRRDVEWYWEGNVRAEYDTVDPSHNRLITQIRCPKFEAYWDNMTAPLAVREERLRQQQRQGFWPLRPNARERKHFEGALILGNHTERWIIPHVSLMAIEDVEYGDFVHDVRKANGEGLRGSTVFRLWGALIKKAYDFVPREVQTEKLREVRSIPLDDGCTKMLTYVSRPSPDPRPLPKRVWMNSLVRRRRRESQHLDQRVILPKTSAQSVLRRGSVSPWV